MAKTRFTPENITKLKDNEIFTFASNRAGRHGKGAAKTAMALFGAEYGVSEGFSGKTYAIPTKDEHIRTLSLVQIEGHIKKFLKVAAEHLDKTFLVTRIGCGLALYRPEDIAPLFKNKEISPNIVFPKDFYDIIYN